jgi:AcrR family transcriptional regulator
VVARPIETSDEELLAAAERVLLTQGPSGFTLAKAAERAGVSAATFVKRFGSKDALFLRLSQRWVAGLNEQLRRCADAYASPLAKFRAVALHNYHDLDNPSTASMQLAALAVDLQNDQMRELLHIGWGHVRTHLARHARDAVDAGELTRCPPPEQLARIVIGAMEGGCLVWSVHPTGSLISRLGADLDATLGAWTTQEPQKSAMVRKEITR